jgi:formylglycine-generating enzyme required for sulfatase activity
VIDLDELLGSHGDDDPSRYIAIADHFLRIDDHHAAAAALDRAYGLSPGDPDLARHRAAILDGLALEEHGLRWRFVPAGTFLMGSTTGDPDERPVHPVRLAAFWIADVPLSWAQYSAFAGWDPPPEGGPPEGSQTREQGFTFWEEYKIRMQYCQDDVDAAGDWHVHAGIPGGRAERPTYLRKPVVAVSPIEAEAHAAARSTAVVRYALPTEAQWEKAARGGLVGKRYAWGDEPPTQERCNFDRLGGSSEFRLVDLRTLPANGYGVYGVCGGVAEWTRDLYDALAYLGATAGTPEGTEPERVLRGGCWTDCAAAVTVSFRTSHPADRTRTPTLGVRYVREAIE